MVDVKQELIDELEKLPEEEKKKPIIATLFGEYTAEELAEEIKKETKVGKKFIEGEIKRRYRERGI